MCLKPFTTCPEHESTWSLPSRHEGPQHSESLRPSLPLTSAALRPLMITAATVMTSRGCVGKTTVVPALLTYGMVQEMCSHIQAMEAFHWGKGEQSRIRATAGILSIIQQSQWIADKSKSLRISSILSCSSQASLTHRILRQASSTLTIGHTAGSNCLSSSQLLTRNKIAVLF